MGGSRNNFQGNFEIGLNNHPLFNALIPNKIDGNKDS